MLLRLFRADLKIIVRNKQSLFWALAFPIIFATIFGLFKFDDIGEADVAVVESSSAPIVGLPIDPFGEAIKRIGPLRLACKTEVDDEAACPDRYAALPEARAALEDGDIDFVVEVGDAGSITLLFDEGEADRNSVFLPLIQQIVDELNLRAANVEPVYRLTVQGVSGRAVKYYDFVLPGLVGMAVMTYGIIGLASTIAQYRGQRVLRRILATPLNPRTFLGSIVLAHLVLAVVQSALVLAWGVFLFGGQVRGNLLWVVVFVLLGNLTFLNIGFMVASRANSAEAASGLGNAVSMPMMFFSGVFFPTATLPWILPAVTSILPLHPLVDALRAIAIDGESITALWSELAQLAGWAVVTFVIASRVFRFERASA